MFKRTVATVAVTGTLLLGGKIIDMGILSNILSLKVKADSNTDTPIMTGTDTNTNHNTEKDNRKETKPLITDTDKNKTMLEVNQKPPFLTEKELSQLRGNRSPFEIQAEVLKLRKELQAEYNAKKEKEALENAKKNTTETSEESETGAPDENAEKDIGETDSEPDTQTDEVTTEYEELTTYITEYSKKYGIPTSWIYAVIDQESKFKPNAINENKDPEGNIKTIDRGLMQINSETAPWLASKIGVKYRVGVEFDPKTNLNMGVFYLAYLQKIVNDTDFIFSAYNMGPTGANKHLSETGTYKSTYSESVTKLVEKYKTK